MEELKKRRASIKRAMTRVEAYINAIRDQEDIDVEQIGERLNYINIQFLDFGTIQTKIEELEGEDQFEQQDKHRREVEEKYFAIKARCNHLLKSKQITENNDEELTALGNDNMLKLMIEQQIITNRILERLTKQDEEKGSGAPQVPEPSVSLPIQTHSEYGSIKLPKFQIPTFSGCYKDWFAFHDLYKSTIHDNASLTPSQKFQFLKSSLRGDAASMLNHLPISDANYKEAWEELNARYNKEKCIINAHLRNICEQPSLKQSPSSTIMRKFINSIMESVRALRALHLPTDAWDSWLVFTVVNKLDLETKQLWTRKYTSEVAATFKQLMEFLDNREYELYSMQNMQKPKLDVVRHSYSATTTYACYYCKDNHLLYKCPKFASLPVPRRQQFAINQKLCHNCLKVGHDILQCKSGSCRVCQQRHHTLLHEGQINSPSTLTSLHAHLPNVSVTLLPTAIVLVEDRFHNFQPCRVLIDSGSQTSLISEPCVQRLGLTRNHMKVSILGIDNNSQLRSRGITKVNIKSRVSQSRFQVHAIILSRLTRLLPPSQVNSKDLEFIKLHELADPTFHNPGQIDLIIGCDQFFNILLPGQIDAGSGLKLQQTVFGFVVGGSFSLPDLSSRTQSYYISVELDELLQQFWKLDECKTRANGLSPEEQQCEEHYKETHHRNDQGRYTVRLPFRNSSAELGESYSAALRSLLMMERRFRTNEEFQKQYCSFMREYENLQHMKLVRPLHSDSKECYYIPHHAVIKESSSTTKLRVVFNASKPTSTGISLNNKLLVGPVVQDELFAIIMRFRLNKIAAVGDITKMYRQILMDKRDTCFQRILWRESPTQPIQTYELQTVTYGTASAPYLATKTLNQLADDERNKFPIGSDMLRTSFYVDDAMIGGESIEEIEEAIAQLSQLLATAGCEIRKWASNSTVVTSRIPIEYREIKVIKPLDESISIKTLGLNWNISGDYFFFKVALTHTPTLSKRHILSEIARIYDPLGWLAPVVVYLKILIQKLWICGTSWDSELPDDILKDWLSYSHELQHLQRLKIPRWMPCRNHKIELHAFADASQSAYAAAVYIRTIDEHNEVHMHLVAAKTRVAPIKQISLPKLELCAALLATQLLQKVEGNLKLTNIDHVAWTDSSIVLAWLSDIPRKWETFVGNRTAKILEVLPRRKWKHIASAMNPADCATRGLQPEALLSFNLWWSGPDILLTIQPKEVIIAEHEETVLHATLVPQAKPNMLENYSSLSRLTRITAHCLRFINNCKKVKASRCAGLLTTEELKAALNVWIRHVQIEQFAEERRLIQENKDLPKKNTLRGLLPFIDSEGILRVGGRIDEAPIAYNRRHPPILPRKHHLTKLIARDKHINYLHAGTKLLSNLLLIEYWIPGYQKPVKDIIYSCTTCTRHRAQVHPQQMGNLPKVRLQPGRPFLRTGVDYAGPIIIRSWRGRGAKNYKAYIAIFDIFVCLATKAYHLELVSSLTTADFIAALKRFIARRGLSETIYSDNGTTFVGADRDLQELKKLLTATHHQDTITTFATNRSIAWNFIPPHSPHFGGVWEAGVKAVKYHLRREIGTSHLTFEELNTLLCQIEAVLNSRPIAVTSHEVDNCEPLTPAHFLIGSPLVVLPESIDKSQHSITATSRWQYVQRLHQSFWKRWEAEYLRQLQRRTKWIENTENLQSNDIVLIKEDNTPPATWRLGRVLEVHPGRDGKVRIATIKTRTGVVKRSVMKICPLPAASNVES